MIVPITWIQPDQLTYLPYLQDAVINVPDPVLLTSARVLKPYELHQHFAMPIFDSFVMYDVESVPDVVVHSDHPGSVLRLQVLQFARLIDNALWLLMDVTRIVK